MKPIQQTAAILLCSIAPVFGQVVVQDIHRGPPEKPTRVVLPYVFQSETFDTAMGIFGAWSRFPQEQSMVYATVFGSVNGSWRTWVGAYDLQVPGMGRLFLKPDIMWTSYEQVRAYINGNPAFPDGRAGTHDSDPGDFITNAAKDGSARLGFHYVLPVAGGREHIIHRVQVDQGLRVSEPIGGWSWNPFTSGRSYLLAEPFYRRQEIEHGGGTRTLRSNGVRLALRHDNTDFVLNPSRGSIRSLALTRDWGTFQSSGAWTHLELDLRKFLDLGKTGLHRQRVLALNAWFSDVPSWEEESTDGVSRATRRPPYFEGSVLGGFYRMRAYPENRFSGRSAVFYSAELRAIPRWNPLEKVSILGSPGVEWWQWVLFGEAGRVAGDLDLGTLHADMKLDVGAGVRMFSAGRVGRLDAAFSEEGWSLVAMVGQAF